MLLNILNSHPQVRSYYIPAYPEIESLEANFQTELLLRGSSHPVALLLLPTHMGNEFSATGRGQGHGKSLVGRCSWRGSGLRDALTVGQESGHVTCTTHTCCLRGRRAAGMNACPGMPLLLPSTKEHCVKRADTVTLQNHRSCSCFLLSVTSSFVPSKQRNVGPGI